MKSRCANLIGKEESYLMKMLVRLLNNIVMISNWSKLFMFIEDRNQSGDRFL